MMYCQLQPLKPLYMVTGALGTQIFGFKNGLIFYRSMVQLVFLFHKMTFKGLIILQMKQKPTEGCLIVNMDWLITVLKPLIFLLLKRNTHSTINL